MGTRLGLCVLGPGGVQDSRYNSAWVVKYKRFVVSRHVPSRPHRKLVCPDDG